VQVTKLYLQDFRQFQTATWEFPARITLIVAPNGFGKTTIIEALHLLSTGKSLRAGKTVEMIRFGRELAQVHALTDEQLRLGMTLTGGFVNGQKTAPKHYLLDRTKKRATDFVGNLLTVVFRPEDLRLIEGAGERRRDYLDGPLILTSQVYREALKNYRAALLRRNKTLKQIKETGWGQDVLHLWDEQMLEYAPAVTKMRAEYVDFVNKNVPSHRDYLLIYEPSLLTRETLESHLRAEIACGHCLIGPQRDNLVIQAPLGGQNVDLAVYGSRGQQRLAVLWLKIAELTFLQTRTGRQPLLLLDDIFSELDGQARELVLAQVRQQATVITALDLQIKKYLDGDVGVINL